MDHKKPFWVWVFCETDGTPSFARIATGVLVGAAIGWVSAIVYRNHALPDFGGLVCFVTALYATNKTAKLLTKD